ncbi:programmed cell death protein 2 [Maniola jurtina]|uniref:programmed cell death protein 2 n=1 Tax=Maniola jurtina TaxID=191418 RepID=UPI001E6883CB|nr:programmed cell death protein 2 [Maniola jurtina]XP_045764784.1 programmed cell death protein 2 [Maniola jurtina]
MSDKHVDIGFLEEKSNWLLHPRFFPSKVGGKPAWLDLKNIPDPAKLNCKKCKEPLIFLCQVYAPFEENNDCFHRTIFIFICPKGSCCDINSAENFVVLRCQLPRMNDYFSFEPYEENEKEDFPMEKWAKLCNVCGIRAPSHCSKCKKVYYCSRKHQILDWQKEHKSICSDLQKTCTPCPNNFIVTEAGKSLLFKEWELIVDEEDKEEVTAEDSNQEMEKLRKMMQEKKAGTLSNVPDSELEQYVKPLPEDKVYNKFRKRIARHPNQVLRYDRGGAPLWITKVSGNLITVPECQYCNGDRQFEFQIMPQLLNFINVGIELNSIDWGVLAIYTCKASCNNGPAYKEEFLVKQDLNNETI